MTAKRRVQCRVSSKEIFGKKTFTVSDAFRESGVSRNRKKSLIRKMAGWTAAAAAAALPGWRKAGK